MNTLTQNMDPNVASVVGPLFDNPLVNFVIWFGHFIDRITVIDIAGILAFAFTFTLASLAIYDILTEKHKHAKKAKRPPRRR